MPEERKNTLPLTIPAGPGKPKRIRAKHGIYSWVHSKRLPQGRAFTKTRRELGQLRTELVNRHGGEAITSSGAFGEAAEGQGQEDGDDE